MRIKRHELTDDTILNMVKDGAMDDILLNSDFEHDGDMEILLNLIENNLGKMTEDELQNVLNRNIIAKPEFDEWVQNGLDKAEEMIKDTAET